MNGRYFGPGGPFSEADGLLTAAASARRNDWGPWDLGILHRPPVIKGAPEGRSTAAGFDVYEEPAHAACEIYPLGGAMQGSRPFVVAAGHACTLYEVHLDMPQLEARGSSSSKRVKPGALPMQAAVGGAPKVERERGSLGAGSWMDGSMDVYQVRKGRGGTAHLHLHLHLQLQLQRRARNPSVHPSIPPGPIHPSIHPSIPAQSLSLLLLTLTPPVQSTTTFFRPCISTRLTSSQQPHAPTLARQFPNHLLLTY